MLLTDDIADETDCEIKGVDRVCSDCEVELLVSIVKELEETVVTLDAEAELAMTVVLICWEGRAVEDTNEERDSDEICSALVGTIGLDTDDA